MKKTPICVLIPTLNEENAIASVVKEIPSAIAGRKVSKIVIDGNSTDDTVKNARKAGAQVIIQQSKGKGAALHEALEQIDCDVLVLVDGDGTYDLSSLEKLVKPVFSGKADMVVATRANREGKAITPFNTVGNGVFNGLVSFFYGKKITDMLSGYRAISMKKMREMTLVARNFEVETELTIEALRHNLRIMEIPLFYKNRIGKTKLHPIRDGLRIFKTLLLLTRDTKPLYFFGIMSFAFFLVSLWPISLVVSEKLALGYVQHLASVVLAAFLLLLSVQTFVFGLLADMILSQSQRTEILLKKSAKRSN